MTKRTVLDVGNCGPDHASIQRMLTAHFDVDVLQAHAVEDTLQQLRARQVDLVLINRKLDHDYSDGSKVLQRIKDEADLNHIPVMILTNYAEHQADAVSLGAELGFGKLELNAAETKQKLAKFLS